MLWMVINVGALVMLYAGAVVLGVAWGRWLDR